MSAISWPTSVDAWFMLLDIDRGLNSCHGNIKGRSPSQAGRRCRKPVSKASAAKVNGLLGQIVTGRAKLDKTLELLDQVARLIMCKGAGHDAQAAPRLKSWKEQLQLLVKPEIKKEPTDERLSAPSLPSSGGKAYSSVGSTKVKIEHIEQSINEVLMAPDIIRSPSVNPKQEMQPTPRAAVTPKNETRPSPRAITPKRESPRNIKSPEHKFHPFDSTLMSVVQFNKTIRACIKRPLLQKEMQGDGFLYIFTFPESYRDASPYLKIGNARDVKTRMQQWHRQCGYKPYPLLQLPSGHYVKLERLVHLYLARERRREADGCPKCGVKHQEWFEVSFFTAMQAVAIWADWLRQQPYDEQGNLKPAWQRALDRANLNDKDCWTKFLDEKERVENETKGEESEVFYDFDEESETDDPGDVTQLSFYMSENGNEVATDSDDDGVSSTDEDEDEDDDDQDESKW